MVEAAAAALAALTGLSMRATATAALILPDDDDTLDVKREESLRAPADPAVAVVAAGTSGMPAIAAEGLDEWPTDPVLE